MRLDEAGHGDHGLAVDDLRARRLQRLADRDDRAILHMDIAIGEIAEAIVHRQHISVADDELAARRQLRISAARLRCGRKRRQRRGCAQSRSTAQKIAAAPKTMTTNQPRGK